MIDLLAPLRRRLCRPLVAKLDEAQLDAFTCRVKYAAYVEKMAAVVLGQRNRIKAVEYERDYAKGEIVELKSELAQVEHELRKAGDDLARAENDNKKLCIIAERDRARVELELTQHNRARADIQEAPRQAEEG